MEHPARSTFCSQLRSLGDKLWELKRLYEGIQYRILLGVKEGDVWLLHSPVKGFDKHLMELLEAHPEMALEYAKLFAELPIPTQLAIMRRRRKLSQRAAAKKMRIPQPHVARTEGAEHDPRLSSVVRAAKALHCHVLLVPDEDLNRLATA